MVHTTIRQPQGPGRFGPMALNVLNTAAVMAGLLAIALEHGYVRPPLPLHWLRWTQVVVAAVLLSNIVGWYVLEQSRRDFLRRYWPDFALAALLLIGLAVQFGRRLADAADPDALDASYLLVVQIYIAAQFILRAVRVNLLLAQSRLHPARLMLTSFLVVILLGAAALKLPRAVAPGADALSWTDALFTSTSATCVTGLVVRATGTDQIPGLPDHLIDRDLEPAGFSRFGQAIILLQIQIGGLGVMIFGTIFAVLLGRQLSLRQGMVMQDMLSGETLGQIGRTVRFIFLATFAVEAVGAAVLYSVYSDFDWSWGDRVFNAVFHSVSAYCNAGFSLTPDSMVRYHTYWQVHGVIAPLIVLGGLGFPVLMNLSEWLGDRTRRLLRRRTSGRPVHMTLHSKLVLATSGLLIVAGAVLLLTLESPITARPKAGGRVGTQQPTLSDQQIESEKTAQADPHVLREEPPGIAVADAFFMSLTARTAGFNTVEMGLEQYALSGSSLFVLILLMVIGGSPASTAGGVKTTTFAVLVMTVYSVVRHRDEVEGFRRSLSIEVIKRAATLAVCYVALVCTVTLLLAVTESSARYDFLQLLFESASACGTVGLSTGVTAKLTSASRFVLIAAMFVGRLGPLTMLFAITLHGRPARYRLPHGNVVLG